MKVEEIVHGIKIIDFIGEKVWFDDQGAGYIWGKTKSGYNQMIGEVRGYGAIPNLFRDKDGGVDFKKVDEFQDALGHWIADAIQQKLEKELDCRSYYPNNMSTARECLNCGKGEHDHD